MKRRISILLVICLLMSLVVGCGGGNNAEPAEPSGGDEPEKAGEEIKIGLALYKFDDTFISTVRDAIEKVAQEKSDETGDKIIINAQDGQGQQATQNDQIDTFITQGYDVLAVNMVDRTAASVVI